MLKNWYNDTIEEIAKSKRNDINVNEFEEILKKISLSLYCFISLCQQIRKILFSFRSNEKLNIEISLDSLEKLYDTIINAYDKTIININKVEMK